MQQTGADLKDKGEKLYDKSDDIVQNRCHWRDNGNDFGNKEYREIGDGIFDDHCKDKNAHFTAHLYPCKIFQFCVAFIIFHR